MPTIRQNGYYNDPAFGQAASNIASMFAPPSAQDAYAYASAGAKKQEADRLAQFFELTQNPGTTRETIDRLGVGAGVYTPTQSYYNVDQGNQVLRDNNAADNTRALSQTRLDQAGQTERALLAPVAANATRFIPDSIASQFGLDPQQIGVVSVSEGERATLPDGRLIQGAPKAPTEAQLSPYRDPAGNTGTARYDAVQGWVDTQNGMKLPQGSVTIDLKAQDFSRRFRRRRDDRKPDRRKQHGRES